MYVRTISKIIFSFLSSGSSDENSSPASPVSNHSDGEDGKPITATSPFDLFQPIDTLKSNQMSGKHQSQRTIKKTNRKSCRPLKNRSVIQASIVSEEGWRRLNTCCGIVYENKAISAVLLDFSTIVACAAHISKPAEPVNKMCAPHSRRDVLIRHINNTTNYILNAQVLASASNGTADHTMTTMNVGTTTPIRNDTLVSDHTDVSKIKQLPHESGHILKNTFKATKGVDVKSKAIVKGNLLKVARNGILERIAPVLERLAAPTTITAPTDMMVAGRIVNKTGPLSVSDKLIDAIGHKFNDNSSDSGYDEILQEPKVN